MKGPVVPVLHVADDMAAMSGGVPAVVRQLATRYAGTGQPTSVVHARGTAPDLAGVVDVQCHPPAGLGRIWGYSAALRSGLTQRLAALQRDGGLAHVHGLWTAAPTLAAQAAGALRVPTVFTAHGMLVPWLWNEQGIAVRAKKAVFWNLLARPALRQCSIVHAITPLERDELHQLLPGNEKVVIPNAIEIGPPPQAQGRERVVLFLGRIEPKKGVDLLIRGFAQARLGPDWRLDIVGPSWSDTYLQQLRALAAELAIEGQTRFVGPVFGDAKEQLLAKAWVLAVPSHSEVVGLVNLESAARGLPSITTHQTGLFDWEEGGGLLVQPRADQVATALQGVAAWSDAERAQRGAASRALVARRYSWDVVMPLWCDLYSELVRKG